MGKPISFTVENKNAREETVRLFSPSFISNSNAPRIDHKTGTIEVLKQPESSPFFSAPYVQFTNDTMDMLKMRMATDYLWNLNKYFNLPISLCTVPYSEDSFRTERGIIMATYKSTWKKCKFYDGKERYGQITFNCESMCKLSDDKIKEIVRHELAHAIVDIRYKVDNEKACGHGSTWIKVAKLLRVSTHRYEN
jgi:hypothetical protein